MRELALLGSALGSGYRPYSDYDFLVDFVPEAQVGLLKFGAMHRELEKLFDRKVDLVSKSGLKRLNLDEILNQRKILYARDRLRLEDV